jgi:hypothetical protein
MGYSGRFMAFLASESAALKSTAWREYFSEWLQPWYVLRSISILKMELIENGHTILKGCITYHILAYFSGPSPSTLELATRNMNMNTHLTVSHSRSLGAYDELQCIARAGKQWKKTIGRIEDSRYGRRVPKFSLPLSYLAAFCKCADFVSCIQHTCINYV